MKNNIIAWTLIIICTSMGLAAGLVGLERAYFPNWISSDFQGVPPEVNTPICALGTLLASINIIRLGKKRGVKDNDGNDSITS